MSLVRLHGRYLWIEFLIKIARRKPLRHGEEAAPHFLSPIIFIKLNVAL